MQKREMSTKEQIRKTVIEKLITGKITGTIAAKMLSVSVRQVKRIKRVYVEEGNEGLIHHARGKKGARKIDEDIERKIVETIKNKYNDFGPLMACEKLEANHKIKVGRETLRQMMIRNKLWKPKKKRKVEYHAWRERREAYGMLQQLDGSYHDWFEGRNNSYQEACLLATVDDATGKITYAVFEENEGVNAVFRFWVGYIEKNGIPNEIYSDKFSTYKINHKAAVDNSELMTQFQRVCSEINIKIIHANSPQAKGRIERLFRTLQDRLVKELRLHNISTIDEANIFLRDVFIPWFNTRYGKEPRSKEDMHNSNESIKPILHQLFSQHTTRKVNADFTVQFKNIWYQLKQIQPTTVYKSDTVIMEERIDGTVHVKHKGHYLDILILPERPKKQNSYPLILTTHKSNWKPPAGHPWRQYITNSG